MEKVRPPIPKRTFVVSATRIMLFFLLIGGGAIALWRVRTCLFQLPFFAPDEGYVLAVARLDVDRLRLALISPMDGEAVISRLESETLSYFGQFLQPCNFDPGVVCMSGRSKDVGEYIVYQWYARENVLKPVFLRPEDRFEIGITVDGLYTRDTTGGNRIYHTAFGGQEQVIADLDDDLYCHPEISPNGKFIAFVCMSSKPFSTRDVELEKVGNRIWLLELEDNHLRHLTEPGYVSVDNRRMMSMPLAWSPDSSRIAFVRSNVPPNPRSPIAGAWPAPYDNPVSLHSVDLAGAVREWLEISPTNMEMSWAPDNKHIAYLGGAYTIGGPRVYVASEDRRYRSLGGSGDLIRWSPDGSYIAVLDGGNHLWVISTDDYRWQLLQKDVEDFTWVKP